MAGIRSESTKNMESEEFKKLQEQVAGMSPEELRKFRNAQDTDSMGFWGEESV